MVDDRVAPEEQGKRGDHPAGDDRPLADRVDGVLGEIGALDLGAFPHVAGQGARVEPLL